MVLLQHDMSLERKNIFTTQQFLLEKEKCFRCIGICFWKGKNVIVAI